MDQRFSDYLTQYKANCSFTETEREQTEVCGVRITVTLYEYDTEAEHRDRAEILMEKDGLCYGCEGIERTHWDFFPVTVDGRSYIFFSKTLYGITLIDPDTVALSNVNRQLCALESTLGRPKVAVMAERIH